MLSYDKYNYSYYNIAESSAPPLYVERLGQDSNGDMWVRSFLINTKRNERGWSVNPRTIRKNVLSIVGKPLILYRDPQSGKIDHHPWDIKRTAEANIKSQEQYAVGRAERVFYDDKTDSYYADAKVTDPQAKAYIKSFSDMKIPLPVSPQLTWLQDGINKDNYYTNWDFTHLAIVEKAAYGPDAKILHSCNGQYEKCQQKFEENNNNNGNS